MTEVKTVSWAEGTAPVAEGTAVFEVYIKTTPERLWEAITDPAQRAIYSFGVQTQSDWTTGSDYTAGVPGVVDISSGTNVEVDPPRLLVQTFDALWSDEVKAQGTTRVTWQIVPGRHVVPPDRDPRRPPRAGQPRAVRRLADDPLGAQDPPGDRRAARHPRLADVLLGVPDDHSWTTHPVTAERFDDFADVINPNRRDTHCWCLSHRLRLKEIDELGDGSRESAARALAARARQLRRRHLPRRRAGRLVPHRAARGDLAAGRLEADPPDRRPAGLEHHLRRGPLRTPQAGRHRAPDRGRRGVRRIARRPRRRDLPRRSRRAGWT